MSKFVERVIQIYQFFKGKSNNQNLLTFIEQKIVERFDQYLKQSPLNIGDLFSYLHLIIKKGCIIRVPAEKRRTFSKSTIKEGKYESKILPTYSTSNFQRRTRSVVSANKKIKNITVVQKPKVE